MRISKKQSLFTVATAHLILYAESMGYDLTYGDAADVNKNDGHHKNSTHHVRLAVDFNLFIDGEWITDSTHEAWAVLHTYWETHLGGSPMILVDANHFSFEHNGVW